MWDFALDPATHDWMFGANHDLFGVDGQDLDRQRIGIRLRIPQGTFIYDHGGRFGSRLHVAQRYTGPRGIIEIPMMIEEALAEMDGIEVRNVDVTQDETDPMKVNVKLEYATVIDEEESIIEDETTELELTIPL